MNQSGGKQEGHPSAENMGIMNQWFLEGKKGFCIP